MSIILKQLVELKLYKIWFTIVVCVLLFAAIVLFGLWAGSVWFSSVIVYSRNQRRINLIKNQLPSSTVAPAGQVNINQQDDFDQDPVDFIKEWFEKNSRTFKISTINALIYLILSRTTLQKIFQSLSYAKIK